MRVKKISQADFATGLTVLTSRKLLGLKVTSVCAAIDNGLFLLYKFPCSFANITSKFNDCN